METAPKSERVLALMTKAEVREIDDWMFANRIRSRGEAIRQLVRLGLQAAASPSSPPEPEPS